ncbi:hypothetical protein BCY86_03490 [Pajaroellobacter abortibovis]|uniref:HTH merR-type domain-containing protein n=1 Tax=Pajaroellobacter abortibovis TaxID=1882918 RepID=A0A1L6MZ52_9BACT|nr:hypothetical protein BCY86_03490 [Pajaroellobacter abortibovis]
MGELAKESGKSTRAIHLYEELRLLKPVARSKGGYRLYDEAALMRIRWIEKFQEMGFALTHIQKVLRKWEKMGSAPHVMKEMKQVFVNKMEETELHIKRLQLLQQELAEALNYLSVCEACDSSRLLSACGTCELHEKEETMPELVAGFRDANECDTTSQKSIKSKRFD